MSNQRRPHNSASILLSKEENEKLFYCLSKRSVSQAAAIVQIYESYPSPSQWNKKCCGVACFVKDNENRSFFIRVYDLWEQKLIWEHEIYNNLKYESQCSFFHYFASNEFWIGLNFASEEEAENFKNVVLEKLQKKAQRREQRRRQAPSVPGGDSNRRSTRQPPPSGSAPPSQAPVTAPATTKKEKEKEKANKKKENKKLTKADISRPTNFLHVGHVGWDPSGNWQVGEEDELKKWCKNLGIDEDSLKDMATVNFIKEFIDQNGGIQAIQDEKSRSTSRSSRSGNLPPPPPPNRDLPPPPTRNTPLPPTPTRSNNRGPAPPPPPSGRPGRPGGHRPPPPAAPMSIPPPPPPSRPMSSSLPPPPPAPSHSNGPPPPPPPPMMGGGHPPPPPPPPPPPGGHSGGGGGGRSSLLSDIRSGASLKTVNNDEQPKSAPTGRDALLEAIRGGKDLKKVEAVEKEEPQDDMGGLGSALLSALSQRSGAIHDSDGDSEDEDYDEDDDDWDD